MSNESIPNQISYDAGRNFIQKVLLTDSSTGALLTSIPVTSTPNTSTTATATQVTVPATANGILILAANTSRKGAIISNPGSVTVYVQQGTTGVTTSNGFGIPAGSALNITNPLYTGAIYGIIASSTSVVTVVEFT